MFLVKYSFGLTDIHLSIDQTLYLSTGPKITKLCQKLIIELLPVLCVNLDRLASNEQTKVGISHIVAWKEKCSSCEKCNNDIYSNYCTFFQSITTSFSVLHVPSLRCSQWTKTDSVGVKLFTECITVTVKAMYTCSNHNILHWNCFNIQLYLHTKSMLRLWENIWYTTQICTGQLQATIAGCFGDI